MTTLIVIDQPPYGSWAGRDALDMTFSLAAFDQPAAMLFLGAGVNWLCKGQAADAVGQWQAGPHPPSSSPHHPPRHCVPAASA